MVSARRDEAAHAGGSGMAGQLLNRQWLARAIMHDLGSPLGSILLYSDLLLASDLEPYARERVQRIREAALRSQALVEGLADVTAPEARLHEAIPVGDVVGAALKILESKLAASGVSIEINVPGALPSLGVERPTLLVLFATLLALAAGVGQDAHRGGTVTVAAQYVNPKAGVGNGELQVRLTGPGVNAAAAGLEASPSEGEDERRLRIAGARAEAESLGGRLWIDAGASRGEAALMLAIPASDGPKSERREGNSSSTL